MPPPPTALSFEQPLPWERAQGASTASRTLQAAADARALFAQQAQLLPALRHELAADPEVAAHLHDVGRRVRLLREHAAPVDKRQQKALERRAPKRVIPSRFADGGSDEEDDEGDDDEGDERGGLSEHALATLDGRIVSENTSRSLHLMARSRC